MSLAVGLWIWNKVSPKTWLHFSLHAAFSFFDYYVRLNPFESSLYTTNYCSELLLFGQKMQTGGGGEYHKDKV